VDWPFSSVESEKTYLSKSKYKKKKFFEKWYKGSRHRSARGDRCANVKPQLKELQDKKLPGAELPLAGD